MPFIFICFNNIFEVCPPLVKFSTGYYESSAWARTTYKTPTMVGWHSGAGAKPNDVTATASEERARRAKHPQFTRTRTPSEERARRGSIHNSHARARMRAHAHKIHTWALLAVQSFERRLHNAP